MKIVLLLLLTSFSGCAVYGPPNNSRYQCHVERVGLTMCSAPSAADRESAK